MKNKTIIFLIAGVVLLMFTTYYIAQSIVFPHGEPISGYFNKIIQYAKEEKWTEAQDVANKLEEYWEKNNLVLTLNYAEADYSLFLEYITRVKSAVEEKNSSEAISQASVGLKLWQNFLKFVPQP